MDTENLAGSGSEEEELTPAPREETPPPREEETPAGPAMGMQDVLAAMKQMMEQQAQQAQLAQADQLAQHADMLARHTQTLVEAVQVQGQRYTDSICAQVKEELMERSIHVEEKLMSVMKERGTRVKEELMEHSTHVEEKLMSVMEERGACVREELRDALGDLRRQLEETASSVAEYRGEVWQLRTAAGGGVGGPLMPPRPPTPTGSLLPPPPLFSHDTPPVSDEEGPGPRCPSPALSRRSFPASGARCRARKPAEYDGKVPWEAYHAQFELMAEAQDWSQEEKAFQLVASLRGRAVEILGHLTTAQRTSYHEVSEALRRRFGHLQQAEVHRAHLKERVRGKGESLTQLAQEVESLVRRSYPTAQEETVDLLARDHFIDALQDQQLQLYVKQAHPTNVQEALTRASEMEAFLRTTSTAQAPAAPRYAARTDERPRHVRARKAQTGKRTERKRKESPEGFQGTCWGCGQVGHMRSQCGQACKSRSLDDLRQPLFKPCCWSCGQEGHRSMDCKNPREVVEAGNATRLGNGASSQPESVRPRTA